MVKSFLLYSSYSFMISSLSYNIFPFVSLTNFLCNCILLCHSSFYFPDLWSIIHISFDTVYYFIMVCTLWLLGGRISYQTFKKKIGGRGGGLDRNSTFGGQSFPYENYCKCYKKLAWTSWPVLFTFTDFFLYILSSSAGK